MQSDTLAIAVRAPVGNSQADQERLIPVVGASTYGRGVVRAFLDTGRGRLGKGLGGNASPS
jgi:hypothetical protein